MSCPNSRPTYCPYCRQPVSGSEIAATHPDRYPSHLACRQQLQEDREILDNWYQELEYREREEDARDDTDE